MAVETREQPRASPRCYLPQAFSLTYALSPLSNIYPAFYGPRFLQPHPLSGMEDPCGVQITADGDNNRYKVMN